MRSSCCLPNVNKNLLSLGADTEYLHIFTCNIQDQSRCVATSPSTGPEFWQFTCMYADTIQGRLSRTRRFLRRERRHRTSLWTRFRWYSTRRRRHFGVIKVTLALDSNSACQDPASYTDCDSARHGKRRNETMKVGPGKNVNSHWECTWSWVEEFLLNILFGSILYILFWLRYLWLY